MSEDNGDKPLDVFQADVPQDDEFREEVHATIAAPLPSNAQFMTVAEVVQRAINQANKFGPQSETRLLLMNLARGLASIATNLDSAVTLLERMQTSEWSLHTDEERKIAENMMRVLTRRQS